MGRAVHTGEVGERPRVHAFPQVDQVKALDFLRGGQLDREDAPVPPVMEAPFGNAVVAVFGRRRDAPACGLRGLDVDVVLICRPATPRL